jgi:hypothetical protein
MPEGTPDATEIRAALARLIASPAFSKSPQLAHFIKFVVDETLAGRGDRIKAYTVAADALGRDANFDPQNDPIVRVEAGRLRRALTNYYGNGGRDDLVIIELPRGSYMPEFHVNTAPRRTVARMRRLRRQLAEAISEKYRLVLLIVVIAAAVSLTVEVLEKTIWPSIQNAVWSSPPETSSPDSTGGLNR